MASWFGVKTFRSPESVRRAFEDADEEVAKLLSGISEYLHRFLASASQLDEKARQSTLLRRIFWYFYGGSPLNGEPDQPATGGYRRV